MKLFYEVGSGDVINFPQLAELIIDAYSKGFPVIKVLEGTTAITPRASTINCMAQWLADNFPEEFKFDK